MTGMVITQAGPDDYATLADLHGLCIDPAWNRADIAGLFAASKALGWIATCEGRAAGFALSRLIRDESELLAIGVLPAHRRGGVARALLDAVMAEMTNLGVPELFLEVAEDNAAARALYGAAGFVAVGRRAEYYRRSGAAATAALVLQKEITPS